MTDSEMPILEHLKDLRKRIVRSFIGVLIGFALVYGFSEEIFEWLMKPLCAALKQETCPVVFTGVAEPFMVYLKVGFLGGFFLAAPWIFYQIWSFISPGLHPHERRYVTPFVTTASLMFVGGACLGYFFIFPFAFEFFLSMAGPDISPMLSMQDYFSFSAGLLFAFGILFEIPVFVVLLNVLGVVSAKTLWQTWRYVIAGIFVLSAIVTPADPYTMLLLGVPLSVIYLLALVLCSLLDRGKKV
jgi:sec-independent protein translocase protein TatC